MNLDNLSFETIVSDEDADFIPILSQEDENRILSEEYPEDMSILPLRNAVLFPGVVLPITAGRDMSISLLQEANNNKKSIAVFTQKDTSIENPTTKDLHEIGTVARILKLLKMPDGSTMAVLQGTRKCKWNEITQTEPYFKGKIEMIDDPKIKRKTKEFSALMESIRDTSIKIIHENPAIPSEATFAIKNIEGDSFMVNFAASNLQLSTGEKQKLLEINTLQKRAMEILRLLDVELQKLQLKNNIQSKVRNDLDQQQREYFLHQQMKTIQEELGGVSYEADVEEMQERAKKKKWNPDTKKHFDKEITRLLRLNPQAPDYSVQRNYLELMLELPWEKFSKDNFDLKHAEKVLNKDHYGMEDVKERILEYLAVLKLKGNMKSPIICLHGPPGVGKTSLGKSIAEALGREYIRISLGGLHDESEIRGHRKTYIGSMPGRIINSVKKAGTSNPVFVLDEIDKLGRSSHGDPSSALLEVLDPEQNNNFHDNYLEIGYDLSKVLFVATTNSLNTIQPALLDRMEIINLSGYTIEEKVEIAKKHLIPKQIKEHGLNRNDISIGKKEIEFVVSGYTRESGVRSLDKKIAKIIRHYALFIAKEEEYTKKVTEEKIIEILGASRPNDKAEKFSTSGVVTGLAWTQVGGDILFIESVLSDGDGKLSITGNLGTVMKESATIALEYIKSNYTQFGIDLEKVKKSNIHIHVPEGATPKDGPSAGITMLTSMVSSFTNKIVRSDIAMTGEITLRGKVLPVGGIKEKILAAKRAGIKEIILCEENKKDIDEIKEEYLKGLKFHYVSKMEEVIKIALR
ncbi:MAG: endopeptidase La [Flavobacteriales bacterium]|nr:endopeptidase La [Flavobacteriales bacterium]